MHKAPETQDELEYFRRLYRTRELTRKLPEDPKQSRKKHSVEDKCLQVQAVEV